MKRNRNRWSIVDSTQTNTSSNVILRQLQVKEVPCKKKRLRAGARKHSCSLRVAPSRMAAVGQGFNEKERRRVIKLFWTPVFIPCEKFPSVQACASRLFRVCAIVSSMVERLSGKSEAVAFNIFLGSPFKQCVTWWKALLRQEAAYPPPSFAAKLKSELAKVCPGEPSPSTDQHLLSVFSDFERHRPWFCSCKTTNQNKE